MTWALLIAGGAVAAIAVAWWRTRRARDRAEARVALLTEAIHHADAGFVLYDANDHLVLASRSFLALYPSAAEFLQPGRRFDEMLHDVVAAGLIPGSAKDIEEWKASRLDLHEEGGAYTRQMADGRWRHITDQRLADGSRLGFSIDVTDLVHKSQALEQARAELQLAHERLEDAIEALPAGFELYDADDRLIMSNQVLRDMFPRVADLLARPGLTFDEIVRANVAAGSLAGVDAGNIEGWLTQRRAQRALPTNHTMVRAGGMWLRTIERRTRDGGLVGVRVDVTETVEQREAAEAARARLQDAIDALPDGFALYDREDRLVICNANYRNVYRDMAPAIIVGNTFEAILRYGLERGQFPQAKGREREWLRERVHQHRHPGAPVLQELPGNRWLHIEESVTRDGGIAGVRADVTEFVRREQALHAANAALDQARARLEQLSDTDGLTGIANRRQFDRRLPEEWQRARRLAQPFALLLIDVDHFKRYNDAHGHPQGDECLRRVATTLQASVRRASDLVARYGGEEFAILLPHTDLDGAHRVARVCMAAIDAEAIVHGDSPVAPVVTVSIGGACAVNPSAGGSAVQLMGAADAALYEAKRQGRHRTCLADPL